MTRLQVLVTVKAYPTLSDGFGESVCIAGVRVDTPRPSWVRLFPVAFRSLPRYRQFKKYQLLHVHADQRTSDNRPESWFPNLDSIVLGDVLGPESGSWRQRRQYIEPLVLSGMCEVQERQATEGTSLGVFRPGEVLDWEAEHAPARTAGQAGIAGQLDMLEPSREALEHIPYKFRYRYRCETRGCKSHKMRVLDWELGQAYRSWRIERGEAGALDGIKDKWLAQLAGGDKDTMFYVGSVRKHPASFCVLGVYWPNAQATAQQQLFYNLG